MLKIALYGNYATQFLAKSLKSAFKKQGVSIELYVAEYDQADIEFYDTTSELFSFKPNFIILHDAVENVRDVFYKSSNEDRYNFAAKYIQRIENFSDILKTSLPSAQLIYPGWELDSDMVYGNFFSRVKHSWDYQLRKFNWQLLEVVSSKKNILFIDSTRIAAASNHQKNHALSINADLHFSFEFLSMLSGEIYKIIQTIQGGGKKCIILDLDNTLWGGIIGDDGVENIMIGTLGIGKAFTRFQKWLKELKNRGIILVVCSKNDEHIAKEAFEKHSEMILRLDDIAMFVANWDNKADNIRYIQSVLNIGFDSMVFIDDNPAERKIVRDNVPGVCVPELPEDPAFYLAYLKELNLFEATTFSDNDKDRTSQYREEAKRIELFKSVVNIEEYLASLEMLGTIEPFKKDDYSRIAQLTQRSNQFNLRTIRYTEAAIESIAADENYITCSVKLKDKFGDHGLISVIILQKNLNELFIDTWLMSCRVLKRGVEAMVLNKLVDIARKNNFEFLTGEYIPTAKNALVKSHYENLGFTEVEGKWQLNVSNYKCKQHFIQLATSE